MTDYFVFVICASFFILAVNIVIDRFVFPKNYRLEFEKLPSSFDGFTLIVISDLHNTYYGKQIPDIIETTFTTCADKEKIALILAGDMIQYPSEKLDNVLLCIRTANKLGIPVYGNFGNHEAKHPNKDEICEKLRQNGVQMIIDKSAVLQKNGQAVVLIGVCDPQKYAGEPRDKRKKDEVLQKASVAVKESGGFFNIVLFHRANFFDRLFECGADLIISGHLHGGVVRLPFIGGLVGEGLKLFPKYSAGVFRKGSCVLVSCRGCDRKFTRTRIFNPPEIAIVTLEKSNKR